MRFILGAASLALLATPTLANDTSAVIASGGLDFITHDAIVMESEDLFISKEEIRVTYRFRNDSDTDQDVLVAFPMPEIVPNFYSPVSFPRGRPTTSSSSRPPSTASRSTPPCTNMPMPSASIAPSSSSNRPAIVPIDEARPSSPIPAPTTPVEALGRRTPRRARTASRHW